jgi:hypothetical protein
MRTLNSIARRTTRPVKLIPFAAVLFVALGTYHWELWEIPWFSDLAKDNPTVNSNSWGMPIESGPQAPLRPLRSTCPNHSEQIIPANRYCAWNTTLQDCYETLMPDFHRKRSWVFLGGDDMANIPYFLSLQRPASNLTVTTRRNPCQNLVYYGLPPPDSGWRDPNPELGEGPIGVGKKHHFCMDCTDCWNVAMTSGSSKQDLTVEYLVVEYARDVSLPSQMTTTTQQTATYYLGKKQNPPSVCVASAGINDAAIHPPVPQAVYLRNVDTYLGLLQRTCKYVIWIGLHAVVEGEKGVVQKNCQLKEWNDAVIALVINRSYHNVYFVDIFDKSFHSDFQVPTRLGKKFYASFARLFKSLMAGPNLVNE